MGSKIGSDVLFASRFFGSAEPCKSGIEFQIYKVPESTDPRSIFEEVDGAVLVSVSKTVSCDACGGQCVCGSLRILE